MNSILSLVKRFFAAAPGAIRDHLNVAEVLRVAVAALLAGGGVYGVLFAELSHLPQIVTPADAAAAAAVLTAISEIARRLGHGTLPPVPTKTYPSSV